MVKKVKPQPKSIQFRPTEQDQAIIDAILVVRPALSQNKAAAIREALYVWKDQYRAASPAPAAETGNGKATDAK